MYSLHLLFSIIPHHSPLPLYAMAGCLLGNIQAQAALMYDAVFVLVDAFTKLLKKKPDQFRTVGQKKGVGQTMMLLGGANSTQNGGAGMTNGGGGGGGTSNNANPSSNRGLDCNTPTGWVNAWEHGDKISRYLRKVSYNVAEGDQGVSVCV